MASFQQEDDTSVLEAALSFVDEFDFDADGLTDSSSVSYPQLPREVMPAPSQKLAITASTESPTSLSKEEKHRLRAEKKRMLRKAGIYSDPNRARNEQTREIAFLREQLEKLQLDLQVLQKTKKNGIIALHSTTQRLSLWQEQAIRQRRKREQAECDNVRLKLAVERQKKMADSLGLLVRKRTRQLNLDDPYTIIEEFTKEVYSNSSKADVKMQQVVRRYVEEDRDIVIRVSHAAPIEVKNKVLRGLTHNVRGFSVAKRSPASTPKCELTQLQLCTQIALEMKDGAAYNPKNVRALTNFLIVHGLKNTVVNREYIENILADRALKHRIE
ncbi:hypothetical protein AM588_10006325 [Phytophthora nicotianae]|uniref:Uncharacterized protein n=1 Tax=Phytophthora nicotianae TaxID=4792 RepID=A0A0W8DKK4_PHYNI|nr:hypothetical protein AM588_10006325 [Phytophthora nicotianae]